MSWAWFWIGLGVGLLAGASLTLAACTLYGLRMNRLAHEEAEGLRLALRLRERRRALRLP